MDPALWELYESGSHEEEVRVILRLKEGAEPPVGFVPVSTFGPIVTGRLKRGRLIEAWESEAVTSLKAPRAVSLPAAGDLSAIEDHPDEESGPQLYGGRPSVPETGRNVIAGVLDWGCDIENMNFRNPDGSTRLLALWDQRGVRDDSPAPFGYGKVYLREEINAALATEEPCATLGYEFASSDSRGNGCHGTHVTDILGGNQQVPGSETGYAPGADLVFVHLASEPRHELANFGDSHNLLEGVDFVRRMAAGRCCVCHLSAGQCGGPHTGETSFEQAVDYMMTERDGIALCQSAGNYAASFLHNHARIGPDQTHTLDWLISEEDRTANELEVWYSGKDVFDVKVVSPNGILFSLPLGERMALRHNGSHWGNLYHRRLDSGTGQNHIDIFLKPEAPAGEWQVVLRGVEVVDGRLQAWIERDAGGRHQSRFRKEQATSSYTTNTICNGMLSIAVGAYNATEEHRPPTDFSSRGPTADGRQKPELAAPGYRIRAARSRPIDGWQEESRQTTKSGTSMAAPCVSGTIALMYEAAGRPLSIHEVRRLLIGSTDPYHGRPGNPDARLGFGYLNAQAAVEAARKLASSPGQEATGLPPADESLPSFLQALKPATRAGSLAAEEVQAVSEPSADNCMPDLSQEEDSELADAKALASRGSERLEQEGSELPENQAEGAEGGGEEDWELVDAQQLGEEATPEAYGVLLMTEAEAAGPTPRGACHRCHAIQTQTTSDGASSASSAGGGHSGRRRSTTFSDVTPRFDADEEEEGLGMAELYEDMLSTDAEAGS